MKLKKQDKEYLIWLDNLKSRIRTTQIKAALSANSELIKLYWDIGKDILEKVQQLVAQIPWGHNILIISKSQNIKEAIFYLNETLENSWSRDVLDMQIGSGLYKRKGNAITNFSQSLPQPSSDLANQTLKDPYLFDFLTLKKDADEKSIEEQLTKHITHFLLELGKGLHL